MAQKSSYSDSVVPNEKVNLIDPFFLDEQEAVDPHLIKIFESKLSSAYGENNPREDDKKEKSKDSTALPNLYREVHQNIISNSEPTALNIIKDIGSQIVSAIVVTNSPVIQGQSVQITLQNVGVLNGVEVKLTIMGGQLDIQFVCEDAKALNFLTQHADSLKKTLVAKSIENIDEIKINFSQQSQQDTTDQRSRNPYLVFNENELENN